MTRVERPGIECLAHLDRSEWAVMCRELARLRGVQWRSAIAAAGAAAVAAGGYLAGVPDLVVHVLVFATLAVAVFAAGYLYLGPLLSWRALDPAQARAHWRFTARRIETDRGGVRIGVPWDAVHALILTPRVLVFDLGARHGIIGLPRRCLTPLVEELLVEWANAEGAQVTRRDTAPVQG